MSVAVCADGQGVFGIPENGDGPLALTLAMGEVSPPQQDLCLDH
jgi:hypothetical protein